jgi:nucleotide-binding universal stress UspA family protein
MTDVSEPLTTAQADAVFSKILVPLNGTSEATAALAPARTMAQATGAAVTLVTVIETEWARQITQVRQLSLSTSQRS